MRGWSAAADTARMCICMYVCMYMCLQIFIYTYIYVHGEESSSYEGQEHCCDSAGIYVCM